MYSNFLRLISQFWADRKGVAAIIFALVLIPLIGAGGAAIDYSRAFIVQTRLASALDAAALAMGASSIQNEKKLKELGQKYFEANYPADKLGVAGDIQITLSDATILVSGTAKLPTSLMGVIGIDNLKVKAIAEVTRAQSALEVVLVLDNTGSMYGPKLSTLKTASNALVDSLFGGESKHPLVKMGLVPFAASVNVGRRYKKSGWIDRKAKSPIHGINFIKKNGKPTNIFTLYNVMKNTRWEGCVEARSYPLDVTDTPPNKNKPQTLWVPYFYPDEPDFGLYDHSYLPDKKGGSVQDRQSDVAKYAGKTPGLSLAGSYAGPALNCEIAPLIPLTNRKSSIKKGINKMVAIGSTIIPIGMAWGWRVISPEEPFTQGARYEDHNNPTTKAIVLMSDGENVLGDLANHNKSFYTGYGYVSQQINTSRLSSNVSWKAREEVDDRLEEVCKNIKNKGILVFSVAFQITNPNTKKLLKSCASGADRFFDATSNDKLIGAFNSIGKQLGELRISK